MPRNLVFVRADLVDYWRLLEEAGLRLARHYILYPNPWPKIGHLTRRWHAHPVFLHSTPGWRAGMSQQLGCSPGRDEHCAVHCARPGGCMGSFVAEAPISPFERKYRDSGQPLYRLELDPGAGASV